MLAGLVVGQPVEHLLDRVGAPGRAGVLGQLAGAGRRSGVLGHAGSSRSDRRAGCQPGQVVLPGQVEQVSRVDRPNVEVAVREQRYQSGLDHQSQRDGEPGSVERGQPVGLDAIRGRDQSQRDRRCRAGPAGQAVPHRDLGVPEHPVPAGPSPDAHQPTRGDPHVGPAKDRAGPVDLYRGRVGTVSAQARQEVGAAALPGTDPADQPDEPNPRRVLTRPRRAAQVPAGGCRAGVRSWGSGGDPVSHRESSPRAVVGRGVVHSTQPPSKGGCWRGVKVCGGRVGQAWGPDQHRSPARGVRAVDVESSRQTPVWSQRGDVDRLSHRPGHDSPPPVAAQGTATAVGERVLLPPAHASPAVLGQSPGRPAHPVPGA